MDYHNFLKYTWLLAFVSFLAPQILAPATHGSYIRLYKSVEGNFLFGRGSLLALLAPSRTILVLDVGLSNPQRLL